MAEKHTQMATIDSLNNASPAEFLQLTGGPLEGELWLGQRVLEKRPFVDVDAMMAAFEQVVAEATLDERITLIDSHPELAVAPAESLSDTSKREQSGVGLNQLSQSEYQAFQQYNRKYREQFGFPFVICVREHTKASILENFEQRLDNEREQEIETGLREVLKIIRLRILDLLDTSS